MIYSENKSLQTIIDQNLYFHHFQPIFNVHNLKTFGYEGLIRSKYAKNPQTLFDGALHSNRLSKLDLGSLFMAIDHLNGIFFEFKEKNQFFLNIYPSTLMSKDFISKIALFIESKEIPPEQFVLELNESESIDDFLALKMVIKDLQSLGIQIALDDIGKEDSSFNRVLELDPEIIKLDKFFSDNLATSSRKQVTLEGVMNYCGSQNITAILEGIEYPEDLEAAKSAGIGLVQGFLLGKPDTLHNHFSMAHHS